MTQEEMFPQPLGEAVEAEIAHTWAAWCATNFPSKAREIVWVEDVSELTVNVRMMRGGRVRITTSIAAKKPWLSSFTMCQYHQASDGSVTFVTGTEA